MIFISLLFISLSAFALTEAEVRSSVLENFPLIQEAELKLKASEAEVRSSEGSFDHKLTFKSRNRIENRYDNNYIETAIERDTGLKGLNLLAGHRQGIGHFPAYDGKYATSGAGEIFAGISLPLLRNFSTDESRTNLALSRLDKELSEVQLRLKRNISVHKALSLYYKWFFELRKLQIRKAVYELATKRNEMLEKKFASGDIGRIKLTDNQRSINKRKDLLLKSELDLTILENQFLLYLPAFSIEGLSQFHAKNLGDPKDLRLPTLPKDLGVDGLPQLKILTLEREKLRASEELYRQQRLPGLDVNLLGARELSSNRPYDPERLELGVKIDYPLENRKAQGKTVAQSYKVQALEKQRTYVDRELTRTYSGIWRSLELNLSRWKTVSQEVEATRALAEAEKRRWTQGSSDLYIVNLREEDVAEAEVRRWNVLYDFQQASIDAKLLGDAI